MVDPRQAAEIFHLGRLSVEAKSAEDFAGRAARLGNAISGELDPMAGSRPFQRVQWNAALVAGFIENEGVYYTVGELVAPSHSRVVVNGLHVEPAQIGTQSNLVLQVQVGKDPVTDYHTRYGRIGTWADLEPCYIEVPPKQTLRIQAKIMAVYRQLGAFDNRADIVNRIRGVYHRARR